MLSEGHLVQRVHEHGLVQPPARDRQVGRVRLPTEACGPPDPFAIQRARQSCNAMTKKLFKGPTKLPDRPKPPATRPCIDPPAGGCNEPFYTAEYVGSGTPDTTPD